MNLAAQFPSLLPPGIYKIKNENYQPDQSHGLIVYLLQGMTTPDRFYIGVTEDLHERLRKHNAGEVFHTSKFKTWFIKTALAFRDQERAGAFER